MKIESKYTDSAPPMPDMTDLFMQVALRIASHNVPGIQESRHLREAYKELATIHGEQDPDKLLVKLGFAVVLEPREPR